MIFSNPADHPAWQDGWYSAMCSLPRDASRWTSEHGKQMWLTGYDAAIRHIQAEGCFACHVLVSQNLVLSRRQTRS